MMKENFSNKDIFIRSAINEIDDYVEYLYENVLLICESPELDKFKGSRIDVTAFTKPIAGKVKIEFKEITKVNLENKNSKNILMNTINAKELVNKVYFVPVGNKIVSLLKHIRNAFAHNLIVIDGDYIVIGDFLNNKRGVPVWDNSTMLGRLSKNNFKLLISTIGKMKNSYESELLKR